MTAKLHLTNGTTMMFGTSYKNWWIQAREYCLKKGLKINDLEISKTKWIGYGGLKWCRWEDLQAELDEENRGRTITEFKFRRPSPIEINCILKYLA